jgi:hypothetical protein
MNNYELDESSKNIITDLSKSQLQLIEKYFISVMNKDTENIPTYTENLLNNFPNNRIIHFFLFWIPIVHSEESMAIEILNRVKQVQIENLTISSINDDNISSSIMNKYAFALALKYNFHNSLLNLVLKQGKINIALEWIYEKLKQNKFEIIQTALLNNNEYQIITENFKAKYKAYLKEGFPSKPKKQPSNSAVDILKQKTNFSSSKRIYIKTLPNKVILSNEFANSRMKKLTIDKVIIIADILAKESKASSNGGEDIIRAVCMLDREKKVSTQVLEGLYISKNKEIALELLEADFLGKNLSVFQTALNKKDIKFLLQFYELASEEKFFDNEEFHNDLIYQAQEDYPNLEIYLYFIHKFLSYFKINSIRLLVKIIEIILDINSTTIESTIIKKLSNPIKIFVLIAEIMNLARLRFPLLEYNLSRLINKCIDYSMTLQNLIEEDILFREILIETDLDGRMVLDIISKNNFLTLLKNKLVEKICDELLNGPYSIDSTYLEVSSHLKSFKSELCPRNYDLFTHQRNSIADYSPENYKTNTTHFMVWRKSTIDKYYLYLYINLFIVLLVQILCLYLLTLYQEILGYSKTEVDQLSKVVSAFLSTSDGNYYLSSGNFNTNTTAEIINSVTEVRVKYTHFVSNLGFMNNLFDYIRIFYIYFVFMPIEYIYRYLYWFKSSKSSLGLSVFSDFLLFTISIVLLVDRNLIPTIGDIIKLYEEAVVNLQSLNYLKTFSTDLLTFQTQNNPLQFYFLKYSIFCSLLWIKLILFLRGTKTFGPIIMIFLLSIKGIFSYIVIFMISVIIYSCIGMMNFYIVNNDGQNINIFYSFLQYYQVSTGNPNYDNFSPDVEKLYPYMPYLSGLFFVIIVLFNTVIFLNLIIALLTNIYGNYYENAIQLFIQKRLEIRKFFSSETECYDSLVVNVYPFNVITFPLALCLAFIKNQRAVEALNRLILKINYWLFAVVYILIFSISTFCLIPLTYLKIIFSKLLQICVDDTQQYFLIYKIFSFVLYIIFGPLLQISAWLTDIVIFCFELEKTSIALVTEHENTGRYSINKFLLKLIRMLKHQYEGELKIPLERFIKVIDKLLYEEDIHMTVEELLTNASKPPTHKTDNTACFHLYHNDLIKRYEKKGINYLAFIDYLTNFVSENDIINVNTLIDMLDINYTNYKYNRYFKRVFKGTSKTLKQKRVQFLFRIERLLKQPQKFDTDSFNSSGEPVIFNQQSEFKSEKLSIISADSKSNSEIKQELIKYTLAPIKIRRDRLSADSEVTSVKSALLSNDKSKNKQSSILQTVKLPIIPVNILDRFVSGCSGAGVLANNNNSESSMREREATYSPRRDSFERFLEKKFEMLEEKFIDVNYKLSRLSSKKLFEKKKSKFNNSSSLSEDDDKVEIESII